MMPAGKTVINAKWPPSTTELNDPTKIRVPGDDNNCSRDGKYNLGPNFNYNYTETYEYWRLQNLLKSLIPYQARYFSFWLRK